MNLKYKINKKLQFKINSNLNKKHNLILTCKLI